MTARTVKLASYNIRKAIGTDRRRDPARILAVLAEMDADVVALQEADRRLGARASAIPPGMLAQHSDYVPVALGGRAASIGWHGNALLVRRGTRVAAAERLLLPMLEPRGAVSARLILPSGGELAVVGMHLDLSGLRRRHQAQRILGHIDAAEPVPTVVMGDSNEWRRRCGWLDEFGRALVDLDIGNSFHSRRPLARLDRIFASRDVAVLDAGVHDSVLAARASDHLPVWATIALPDAAA